MEQQTLQVETRTGLGKGHARKIRREGKLPGVLYGRGTLTSVVVDPKTILKLLLEEGGRNKVLSVTGEGLVGKHVLVKDYQIDPVKRTLLHVDLLEIDISKKILVTVAVNLVGKAAGVADGGMLNIIERSIEVRCLPNAIPKHIDVDVSSLKIGDSLHLSDLTMPEGIEAAGAAISTIVTCVPPTKEEEAAPSLAPAAEPEVITAKAPAEGEAAAAGKDEKKK